MVTPISQHFSKSIAEWVPLSQSPNSASRRVSAKIGAPPFPVIADHSPDSNLDNSHPPWTTSQRISKGEKTRNNFSRARMPDPFRGVQASVGEDPLTMSYSSRRPPHCHFSGGMWGNFLWVSYPIMAFSVHLLAHAPFLRASTERLLKAFGWHSLRHGLKERC